MERSLLLQFLPENVVYVDNLMELIVLHHDNIVEAIDLWSVPRAQFEISVDPYGQLLEVKDVVVVHMVYQKNEPSLLVLKQLDFQ